MMQRLTLVVLLLVAAGCGDISSERAPKHSSQSQPQVTAATTQSGAQAESQRDAEATMRRELDQTSARHAVRKVPAPGSTDLFSRLQPGADGETHRTRSAFASLVGEAVHHLQMRRREAHHNDC